MYTKALAATLFLATILVSAPATIQSDEPPEKSPPKAPQKKDDAKGGMFFGGPMAQKRTILKQFDKDKDGMLNKDERGAAREFLKNNRRSGPGRGPGGFGPAGFFGKGDQTPPKPGPKMTLDDVKSFPNATFYDPTVVRTLFLEFEEDDWEAALADFYRTDVEVPTKLTVDGNVYPNVGVHFRGSSSYMGVGAGRKRSLSLSMDLADSKQKLYGYKSLNLLNSHDDPSMMSTVLSSQIYREHMPAPKANFVKVVINGEYWGVYVNTQQFDKEFLQENFKTTKGARWKVKGNPGGGGGLDYLGEDIEQYKRRYEIKSTDDPKSWKALIQLCKTLSETPPEKLEEALRPILDTDSLLWFLAIDNAVINCDGYWIRASDYHLFRDERGVFHIVPHDMNECFRPAHGPGMGGGFAFITRGPGGGPDAPPGEFVTISMPRPGEVLPEFLLNMLELSEEQRKQVADLQKEIDDKLNKLLTDKQRKQLQQVQSDGPPGPQGPRAAGPGGGGRGGVHLDPLIGMDDARKPLRSKILAVPSLRARYLQCVKTVAEESFDWNKVGPTVSQLRNVIEADVKADTRKLDSFEEFDRATAAVIPTGQPGRRGPTAMNLRAFFDQRRAYLLNYAEPKPGKTP